MKRDGLPKINLLYQHSNKKKSAYLAGLDLQENINKEKCWKNFSKFDSLSKQAKPSIFLNTPYQKYQPYQPRGYNREEEQKFQEINEKNRKNYNKKLLEQQKEELSKLHNFDQKATKINKIKLPIIPNRFEIKQKQDYANGKEKAYEKLLETTKKPSKEELTELCNKIRENNYKKILPSLERLNKEINMSKERLKELEKLYKKHKQECSQQPKLKDLSSDKYLIDYLDSM